MRRWPAMVRLSRRPYDASGAGMRNCADLGGTSCAGYGTDRPQTRQCIQNIRHCAVDIGIACREVAEYRHRRPPTGRTNGRFLCVVLQFFSWRFAGAPSETSRPCLSAYSMQARGPRFGDCLLALSDFDRLYCTLLYCASSGRSFAYMWGAGLRADLKFSTQRLNEEKSAQRARHEQRPAQTEVLGTQRVSFKERNRGMLTAAAGDSST